MVYATSTPAPEMRQGLTCVGVDDVVERGRMARTLILEQSSKETASLASKALRDEHLTQTEVKSLAGSVMRHRRLEVLDGGTLVGIDVSFPEDSGSPTLLLHLRGDKNHRDVYRQR